MDLGIVTQELIPEELIPFTPYKLIDAEDIIEPDPIVID